MNKLTIIGNCTRDPEQRTTSAGKTVTNFTVAVNRRKRVEGQPDADFFRVSAWGDLGEICQRYLVKGKKVCVVGAVGCKSYTNSKGEAMASLEVMANEVEFLSPPQEKTEIQPEVKTDEKSGMAVVDTDDLPF